MTNLPSTKSTQVLLSEHLTSDGALLIPSRLPGAALRALVQLLGGRDLILAGDDGASFDEDQKSAIADLGLRQYAISHEQDRLEIAKHIRGRGLAIFVPSQAISQHATTLTIPRRVLEDLLSMGCPVQPLFVEAPRESLLSVASPGRCKDWVMAFGKLVGAQGGVPAYWESLLFAGEAAFSSRPALNGHLGRCVLQGIKKHGKHSKVVDGDSGKATSYAHVLAAALGLVSEIKKATSQPRVAIVLPPGPGALIANLAVVLAGKVPVNLNFTAGNEAVESAIRQSEVDKFITADIFVRKVQTFPWPALKNLIFIERLIPLLLGRLV